MDRRVLSPIQLAAITRIYGEHGAEILELLRKNPCKTIPIILDRLRQKDIEWRVVSASTGCTTVLGSHRISYVTCDVLAFTADRSGLLTNERFCTIRV